MKLTDRLMAWFGYVPAERLAEAIDSFAIVRCVNRETLTGPKYVQSHVLVATDFKRGIPCS